MEVQVINSPSSRFHHTKKMSMKKKIFIGVIIAVVAAIAIGVYLFNKPHQSISGDSPAFILDAKSLANEYETNEAQANSKYLGKVVEVSGSISEKVKDSKGKITLTLQGADLSGVGCEFEPGAQKELSDLHEGEKVIVKGICTGVLMDVVLVDCVIKK
jgi:hypothetical protein